MVTSVTVNQRGAILLALIGTMLIFSVLGAAMLSFTSSSTFNQLTSTGSARAYYLAEGGMRYAGSQFKNAGNENAKDNMLESLNNHDFSMGSDGMFHLDVYPYYFKTTAIPSGTTLSAKFPGSVPTGMSLPTTGYLKIGNTDTTPRSYTDYSQTGSNITFFTMSPALTGFTAAVNNVLPVGQASGTTTTLTRLGTLTLSSGAGAFPLINGTFTIGTAASTTGDNPAVFSYKTRSDNDLQGVRLSQTPTEDFSVDVPPNAYITLMKFVNVKSRGEYTPLQASRTISYNVPIGFVQESGKAKFTDTFEDLSHWAGELGSHTITEVGGNKALYVTTDEKPHGGCGCKGDQKASLITFKWGSTGADLNQSWELADHLLSYDTQVKIWVNGQDYYMAGIIFRVDASSEKMYGVSYLRANKEKGNGCGCGKDKDEIPDKLCPLSETAMIVLWREKPKDTLKWLAYKTLTTADGVVNDSGQLVDWSTLLVRLIEADSLKFDNGGTGTLRHGDIITGAISGATAKVNGTPILTFGGWGTHDAAGWLTVSNVTKTSGEIQFESSGEDLTVEGVVRARYTGESRQKDNYIRVYYGSTGSMEPANSDPLDNNRLGIARLTTGDEVTWPVDDVADWAPANDAFTLVQWNDDLNLDAGDVRLGTGSEANAIIRTNALPSPSSGTFKQPEIGLNTWGESSVYFDDFGLQTAAPPGQGFVSPIQQ